MNTLGTLLKEGAAALMAAGIEEAGLDAWFLLEFVTGKNRAWYFAHQEEKVSGEQEERYRGLIESRAKRIPLQHLTHQAFFMGYEFYVDARVLIPRQDTETLVQAALALMKGMEKPRILDLCTGSGCILLSLLLEREDAVGLGTDISAEALAVAKENCRRLGMTGRTQFARSDLFSGEIFRKNSGAQRVPYDVLISNPPYIRTAEIDGLMEEVRLFDPREALDGHEDGLYFYRRITEEGLSFLKPGGWLLYEIGYDQGEAVVEILRKRGFSWVEIKKDLAGLNRVVVGRKEAS